MRRHREGGSSVESKPVLHESLIVDQTETLRRPRSTDMR